MSDFVAIMAIDPGVTTGVACGVFDLGLGSVADCLRGGVLCSSYCVGGPGSSEISQALDLYGDWRRWREAVGVLGGRGRAALDMAECCQLVCEDWTPRLPLKSGKREVFYPVRVPAMLEGLLVSGVGACSVDVVYQMPGMAISYCTDERLRRWGKWVKGSTHRRDAWRHVACRLNVLLG